MKETGMLGSEGALMRITGGIYRGRRILCPPGVIRPAMDRMRESLFSILGSLEGECFLDLFSGSGLVGIEAASRGAGIVDLVEMDRKKKDTIKRNISFVESQINLYMMSAQSFMRRTSRTYGIIYADPPFPMGKKEKLVLQAQECSILKQEGMFIIHHPAEEQWDERIGRLRCIDVRTYGRSVLRFFRYDQSSSSGGNDSI